MTREEKEQIGKYVLQMARLLEDGCYQQEMLLKAVHIIDEALEQEPTTKNDLGVDCISRQAVLEIYDEWFATCNIADRKASPKAKINALPSVTPQESRNGEWLRMSDLSEQEDDRYKCSRCGNVVHHKNKMDLYTFNSWCGRCGSDNGRHINYEVEE